MSKNLVEGPKGLRVGRIVMYNGRQCKVTSFASNMYDDPDTISAKGTSKKYVYIKFDVSEDGDIRVERKLLSYSPKKSSKTKKAPKT